MDGMGHGAIQIRHKQNFAYLTSWSQDLLPDASI